MTVTSAQWTSSAADQFDSTHAKSQTSQTSSHGHSFSHVLTEAKRDKEDGDRAASNQNKARKAEEQLNAKELLATASPAKPVTKPPITGQFGLEQEKADAEQSNKADANAKNSLLNSAVGGEPSSLSKLLLAAESSVPDTGPLSGTDLGKGAGSTLMARLLQAKSAGVSAPEAIDSDEEVLKAEQSPDLSSVANGLVSPVVSPIPAPVTAPAASSTEKQSGTVATSSKSAVETTPPDSDAPEPLLAAMPGHLAFALRLNANFNSSTVETFGAAFTAAESASTSSLTAAQVSTDGSVSATFINTSALASDSDRKKDHSSGDAQDGSSPATLIDPSSSASSASNFADAAVPASDVPVLTQAPELDERFQNFSSEPVRNVLMQVVGDDNRRVDVRLLDRAGELRVSVKSGDSTLNQTLQNQMPELTSQLESARYQTEVWMPTATGPNQSPAERDNGNADGQQKGRQQDRPDWVDDLESATPRNIERIN